MRWLAKLFFALVMTYLSLPLIVIAGVSLNAQRTLFFPPQGFSLRWYGEFFRTREWLLPALSSLTIATLAALVAVSVALPLAYVAWAYRSRFARLLLLIGFAPFALPPVVTALGALVLWTVLRSYGQPYTVVLSHGIFLVTLPLATISLGLRMLKPEITEAAQTMGADAKTIFRTIVLPWILPYIIAGYIFAFVLSLNEYLIAYMTVGFTMETLPIKIFNSLRYGYSPVMAAASLLFFLLAILLFSLIGRFGNLPRLLGADSSR